MSLLSVQLLTVAILSLQRQLYHNRGLRLDELAPWWKNSYDFIVVGGGTAGSIVAARLSEVSTSVLLLEAGGPVTITSDIIPTYYQFEDVWPYRTVPQRYASRGLADRRVNYPRGQLLGGSSSINYGNYIRGNRNDFDSWSTIYGASGWTFSQALRYFIKSENNTDAQIVRQNPGYHGTRGPVQISTVPNPDPIMLHWNEAARRMGWPLGDVNGPEQFGSFILQSTTSPANWTRQNAFSAFIEPILLERPHLHVLPRALVTRILFESNSTIACGVEFQHRNVTYQVAAKQEVILSGGSINSAQLLMLSGIGPREHLEDLGIPVLADLPVGKTLSDHFIVPMDFLVSNASDIDWSSGRATMLTVENLYTFFAQNTGPLTRIPSLEMLIATGINGDREWPDGMMYLLINQSFDLETAISSYDTSQAAEWRNYLSQLNGNQRHFQLAFSVFRPQSIGTLRLASRDPTQFPLIDPNYLSSTADLAATIRAMSIGMQIVESEYMRSRLSFYGPIPGCQLCPSKIPLSRCYSYLACAALTYTETTSHPVATCRMGAVDDPAAVVDGRLRLRGGVKRLRVVDASVMPTVPNTNTNAATMMVAERGADLIKEDLGLI